MDVPVPLLMKKLEFTTLFTLSILIKVFVPGTLARLIALLEKGPDIPGPLKKKPKASFTLPLTNSKYSSEAKTKLKAMESLVEIKSNSKLATS